MQEYYLNKYGENIFPVALNTRLIIERDWWKVVKQEARETSGQFVEHFEHQAYEFNFM